jgi:hypothetical protein
LGLTFQVALPAWLIATQSSNTAADIVALAKPTIRHLINFLLVIVKNPVP